VPRGDSEYHKKSKMMEKKSAYGPKKSEMTNQELARTRKNQKTQVGGSAQRPKNPELRIRNLKCADKNGFLWRAIAVRKSAAATRYKARKNFKNAGSSRREGFRMRS
jgi:hypothetical protein